MSRVEMVSPGYLMQKVGETLDVLCCGRESFEERLRIGYGSLSLIAKEDAPPGMNEDFKRVIAICKKYQRDGYMAPISDEDRFEVCRRLKDLYFNSVLATFEK